MTTPYILTGTATDSVTGKVGTNTATFNVGTATASYDTVVLGDGPVAYYAMNTPALGTQADLTGNGHTGTYKNGPTTTQRMPDGSQAAIFNGSNQYMTIPNAAVLGVPHTGQFTWEAWIRPAVVQFPNNSGGYVDFMGKIDPSYSQCEWESRMYNQTNPQGRISRLSAYCFNLSGGLGSGADWQPADATQISSGQWLHVVGVYQDLTGGGSTTYPGTIDIWVDSVPWDAAAHHPTGYMSQYSIKPTAGTASVQVGTAAQDCWFEGAIGKVAFYDKMLTQAQITNHFQAMSGITGSAGTSGSTCTLSAASKALT